MSWEIEVPEAGIKVTTQSIMSDQEMIYGNINYWEGPLKVTGTVKNKQVDGIGFMELVGFPSKYNYLMLWGKEVNKKFWAG